MDYRTSRVREAVAPGRATDHAAPTSLPVQGAFRAAVIHRAKIGGAAAALHAPYFLGLPIPLEPAAPARGDPRDDLAPRSATSFWTPDATLSSAAAIVAFTFLFGAALFPHLITSSAGPEHSLTVSRP